MEFFALAQCPLTATQIQDTLRGQQLAAWCATINRVLHWEDEQGEIYSLWGQFRVRREVIRGGVRFTLPDCPNALAWTLTVAPPAVGREASPGIQVHCTINRAYAARGISTVMPHPWLCRVIPPHRYYSSLSGFTMRHNADASAVSEPRQISGPTAGSISAYPLGSQCARPLTASGGTPDR